MVPSPNQGGQHLHSPEKNIKLATYASRCIENEILMYLRKNQNRRREISIDEPLNIDWDGNELLLSDVLGTEPDVVSSGIERESEARDALPGDCRAGSAGALHHGAALRTAEGRARTHQKRWPT